MALIPYLLDELLDSSNPLSVLRPTMRFCPYKSQRSNGNSNSPPNEVMNIHITKDGFKAILDVQQFQPDEITVKTVDDYVVVEGKHEERQDAHGFVKRQFLRRYKLPEDVELDDVTSSLSSDGVLTISAPKKKPVPLPNVNERIVPIVQTHKPAIKQHGGNNQQSQLLSAQN